MPVADKPDEFLYGLFCFKDVPVAIIDEVIAKAAEESKMHLYWLADTYETLPKTAEDMGTPPPINPRWLSPFVSKTNEDAALFIQNAPAGRGLNRTHFAVLDQELYKTKGLVTLYNIKDGVITSIPCEAGFSSEFLFGYDDGAWEDYLEEWNESGRPLGA